MECLHDVDQTDRTRDGEGWQGTKPAALILRPERSVVQQEDGVIHADETEAQTTDDDARLGMSRLGGDAWWFF
jgi:hypothetical protein